MRLHRSPTAWRLSNGVGRMHVGSNIEDIVEEMYIEIVMHRNRVSRQMSPLRVGEGVVRIPIT